jgi:hypothetical protein
MALLTWPTKGVGPVEGPLRAGELELEGDEGRSLEDCQCAPLPGRLAYEFLGQKGQGFVPDGRVRGDAPRWFTVGQGADVVLAPMSEDVQPRPVRDAEILAVQVLRAY